MEYLELNNGFRIPQIGIGTYKVENQKDIDNLIQNSYNNGYTMLDTASYYNNENLIGNFFKNNPKLKNKFIISTKIWPVDFNEDDAKRSIENSLTNLSLDKLDIMFLHWPSEGFVNAWKVLENYYEQGVFNSIAVCNFHKQHMDKLLANSNIPPSIDQIESHPYLVQEDLSDYLRNENIDFQSWSPLGRANQDLFNENILLQLSENITKTVAQVILRWHVEKGRVIIPKSVINNRIKENIEIFDFSLNPEEIQSIDKLNKNLRFSNNPNDDNWLNKIRNGIN